ncbi:Coiled-coil domain-containing protein lobo [Eumeta japonica]|uniref:Coiled-coil domain-containing protein lobo n=1 Tax=Eumeta variegata TaxID=151549 RepID=A0A4C1TV01_EUMVA|nr:Coiled-coil domain-containing protein lobo [Eumeta japonica]
MTSITVIEPLEHKLNTESSNEAESENCDDVDRLIEKCQVEEIPPRIFTVKDMKEPLTCKVLNNVIYELGIVSLCWPEIEEPAFETRTCFPRSYYTNTTKERLLLAYAENFRQQFHFYYKNPIPLLLQAPNECGLQKMVCTSIRPTKLCFAGTTSWEGIASLVSDYFNYEPLTKPMLHKTTSDYLYANTLSCDWHNDYERGRTRARSGARPEVE